MVSIENMEDSIRVLGLCGSLRQGSYTRSVVRIALQGAEEVGAATQLIDLNDYELPFCNGNENEETYPEDVFKLRKETESAQGLILGTPEYHGGYSGVLKNALDLMGFKQIEGKMIGLVGVSGGSMGASGALAGLRSIGRALHAWVIPEQASIPTSHEKFDQNGNLKSSDLTNRVMEVGRQVARFSFLHTADKAMDFVQMWQGAPLNPGGKKASG